MKKKLNDAEKLSMLIQDHCEIVKQHNAAVTTFCDNLNRKMKEKEALEKIRSEEEAEAQRVRRIINPNFPDQEWRAYSYQELSEICKEWGNELPYAFRAAFIRIGINMRKADIDFYHGGDLSKAKFYPTELNWMSFTIIVNGKPLTDGQREINNLGELKGLQNYSDCNPQMIIPEKAFCWRGMLTRFCSYNLQ